MLIIRQIFKFLIVGASGTIIDLGILNALMWATGIFDGPFYAVFKGLSFIVAVVNSYIWNKFWTFRQKDASKAGKEFIKFFMVASGGLAINVSIASAVVMLWDPPPGISPLIWANFGAVLAVFGAATWDFLGYKFLVFRK